MYDFLYFTFFPSLYLKMVVKLKMNAYLLHLIKGSLKKNTLISRSLVFFNKLYYKVPKCVCMVYLPT